MPYIHCEICGTGAYSNVMSCPSCRTPVKQARVHRITRRGKTSLPPQEDVEVDVRDALYGWHSGTVALRDGQLT